MPDSDPQGPVSDPRYANREMPRREAQDICIDVGHLISDKDAWGRPLPHTCRVSLRPMGLGYDLSIPAELIGRLYDAGYRKGLADGRDGN